MIVNPVVSSGGSTESEIIKEVDWAEFSKALSNQTPPKFNTGLFFVQNASIYNGGFPVVVRTDLNYNNSGIYLITENGMPYITYNGNADSLSVSYMNSDVMSYDDISVPATPPTFADGWSARYFILDL